jgi:GT2 family glycosyltransferase
VERLHPDAVVLHGDGDLWWAGATNVGVEYALAHGADYVLTLNSDGVLAPSAIAALLDAEGTAGPGVYCSRRHDLRHPHRVCGVGVVFDWSRREGYRKVPAAGMRPVAVDACGANAMLVPRRCFEEVGLFDADRLPQNYSDWDFQLRAKAVGWATYTVPGSVVYEEVTTRGPRCPPRLSVMGAARLLTSRRSGYYPPYQWRFFGRHAPDGRLPALLFWRYGLVARSVVWHYLRLGPRPPATDG